MLLNIFDNIFYIFLGANLNFRFYLFYDTVVGGYQMPNLGDVYFDFTFLFFFFFLIKRNFM